MKAIMVMFDSLNRRHLPPYGCDWTHAPNFQRLAQRTARFNQSYVCSMPCMPARRDLHTGRPNFLHRSWGPLEPFDDSVPRILGDNGTSSHLISDHYHYWEAGGATYHTQYDTWEFFRGQEGDPWKGKVAGPDPVNVFGRNASDQVRHKQDRINREFAHVEADWPQAQTFQAGCEFIRRNHDDDNWFLQIETFDPHEPFFSHRQYKDHYADAHYNDYNGPIHDWPPYANVTETPEQVEHMRYEYLSTMAMCDAKLGDVLDLMDKHEMWDDTMLVVWTDHGFLLGEHDSWAKCWLPFYDEVAHTPFFVWDPRSGARGVERNSLVQPSIDLGPTLLDFFGLEPTKDMLGKPLGGVVADDTPVRDAAIFGQHGHQLNVTDGRYVYMRAPAQEENRPLNDYTLMPTRMTRSFTPNELRDNIELAEPFSFTKGCRTMKIGGGGGRAIHRFGTNLYDLVNDPEQQTPLSDPSVEARMIAHMKRLMAECDAPPEQYERLGL
ncbi:MAG: sulfatase [Candidatus Poribacteria bacterium]|nr:sulfatase [Candidatus Poribacteria bacterium]